MSIKSAICVLFPVHLDGESFFVGISRKNNSELWGLPGGKVDPGENILKASVREVWEELGLSIEDEFLNPLMSSWCVGNTSDEAFWVTTFIYTGEFEFVDMMAEDGLQIRLMTEQELCDTNISPFAKYNQDAFKAYGDFLVLPNFNI